MDEEEFRNALEKIDIRILKEEVMKYNKNVAMIPRYTKLNKKDLIEAIMKYKEDFYYLLKDKMPKSGPAKSGPAKSGEFNEEDVPQSIRDLEAFDILAGYIDTVKKATRLSQLKDLSADLMDELEDYDKKDIDKIKKYITIFREMLTKKMNTLKSPTEAPKVAPKEAPKVAPKEAPKASINKVCENLNKATPRTASNEDEFKILVSLLATKDKTRIEGQFKKVVAFMKQQTLNSNDRKKLNMLIDEYRKLSKKK